MIEFQLSAFQISAFSSEQLGNCMTLLQQREGDRMRVREEIRAETRAKLKMALSELLPGAKVLVFGSLTQSGKFNANSDVDIALFEEPTAFSINRLPLANFAYLAGEILADKNR